MSGSARISYGELLARIQEIGGGIQALKLPGPIVIGEADAIEGVTLFLAGLFAARPVFLVNLSLDPDVIAAQLADAKASIVLTAGRPGKALERVAVPIIRRNELKGTFSEAGGAKRANDSAVLLASGRGVVVHSHFSLSAMSAALAAFIIRLREVAYLCTDPTVGTWETLAPVLLALLYGMPIVFMTFEDMKAGANPSEAENAYVILQPRDADRMMAERRVPQPIAKASHIFVSTGPFTQRWRRKFEALCGRPIFPLWGLPELGPLVASHPTWLPIHGHGFPLVNVSLIPIDPGSGKISIVPWELLEHAEVGVESLSAMLGYAPPARNAAVRVGTALRTYEIASMDHVGVVVLHGPTAGSQRAADAN